jgi:FkbM family methyltransferase
MLISLHFLVEKYNIHLKGILHVGAHECEEIHDYEKYIPRNKILWIEALLDKVTISQQLYPTIRIMNVVASDGYEIVTFNRSNNNQSSSFLELGLHKQFHPDIHFVSSHTTMTVPLLDIIKNNSDIDFNFINLDVQGTELKVLKGMESYLTKVDYIYSEVNTDYVYENCALVHEIDTYLSSFGFKRVETSMTECKWGDAFYMKQ